MRAPFGLASAVATAVLLLAPPTSRSAEGREIVLSAGTVTRWAYLLGPAVARARPSATARVVTTVAPATPEGESNLVVVLAERRTPYAPSWVRVRLSILPNGSTGWILRDRLGELHTVRTRVVVDRARLTLTLLRDRRPILRAPVGVGTRRWPTPAGAFYVRQRLAGFGDPFYGPVAFGLSARSSVLTDWPGGGYVGIHGTDAPDLLPGRVSHGCIRMRNADITRLARRMPLGTPVTIR
jgi:lipoprotein-anchoring transpeptidase ErfK/SrfK